MSVTTHWALLRPHMTDLAESKVDAACGGIWWRAEIVQQGGGLFMVDPKCRNSVGEPIMLDFRLDGTLISNPDWNRIKGRAPEGANT